MVHLTVCAGGLLRHDSIIIIIIKFISDKMSIDDRNNKEERKEPTHTHTHTIQYL